MTEIEFIRPKLCCFSKKQFDFFVIVSILFFCMMQLSIAGKAYPKNYSKIGPGISMKLLNDCPLTKGFDFPVGKPNAKKYYNAQKFARNNHLADDWNGVGGGNTDLHDPIYSIAAGIVTYARMERLNWGRVVRIIHNKGTKNNPIYVESVYAHMRKIMVKPGMVVKRGQQIGTIGNAGGVYYAHLHLEIRSTINKPIGTGYSADTTGYLDPTKFIKSNRPRKLSKASIARKRREKQTEARQGFKLALLKAAEERANQQVFFDGRYKKIAFPMGDIMPTRGSAADVIIRVFRAVEIDLQKELHRDIKDNFTVYPQHWGLSAPDTNIDHRRISNLQTFFTRLGKSLSTSATARKYQAGDIVTWKLDNGFDHIGIIVKNKTSDRKRRLVLHNIGLGPQIEDILFEYKITGHYRYYGPKFNKSKKRNKK